MINKQSIFFLLCSFVFSDLHSQEVQIRSITEHLKVLTKTEGFRNIYDLGTLNKAADYIHSQFKIHAKETTEQKFFVKEIEYRNIIASFGIENQKRIIIGAHYDVCEDQEGADDNASGIVGLLELAKLFEGKDLNVRIDLVAYSLEEPPFFRSENMGSFVHAKYLKENNIEVEGMICLEMIGYFDERKKTQDYPIFLLDPFYGTKGNYITLVSKFGNGKFSREYIRNFKRTSKIRDKKFKAPRWTPGLDLSDHRNYWHFGYSAVMITDTGFFRNKNYHEKTDTMETLDLKKMKLVIESVYLSLKDHFR